MDVFFDISFYYRVEDEEPQSVTELNKYLDSKEPFEFMHNLYTVDSLQTDRHSNGLIAVAVSMKLVVEEQL